MGVGGGGGVETVHVNLQLTDCVVSQSLLRNDLLSSACTVADIGSKFQYDMWTVNDKSPNEGGLKTR